jgi:branched-chain amino acid transport system permease protein
MTARVRSALLAPALVAGSYIVSLLVVWVWGDGPVLRANAAVVGLGGVKGAAIALVAVGIVLIYRSGRIINFAQAGFGVAATMLYLLVSARWGWSWWLAAPTAVLVAAVVGFFVEVLVVRRFARAPRLVLTVVTIALAQALSGLALNMPRWYGYKPDPDDPIAGLAALPPIAPKTPFERFSFDWYPVRFSGDHVAAIVVAAIAMVGLGFFLRRSRLGVAIRGASENTNRAELLGIKVSTLSSVVWVIAAVLGATGGIVSAMVSDTSVASAMGRGLAGGGSVAGAVGSTLLLRALAAAVIARMSSVPVAVAAAISIAMFEQGVYWATGSTTAVDVVLLGVVIAALLLQRRAASRFDESETASWESTEEISGIPSQLAPLPQVRAGVRRSLWVLAAVIAVYPWVMSPSQTNLGGVYAIYGIVGISLVVLTGWAGQISLGQFGFVGIGAAAGGAVTAKVGLPFPIALLVGSAVAGAVAVAIGLPALRIKGLFLAVTTLAFSVAMSTWFLTQSWVPDQVHRPKLLGFDSNTDERTYYYVCVAGLALAIFLAQGLRRTRTGRVLIAMRDNERTAQAYGINLVRVRLVAFAISGMFAGFAGVLFAHHQNGVSAISYGPEQSIQMFLMAVIGGLGSVYAVLVGALYIGTCTVVLDNAAGQLLASSFGVIAILLFFPSGLGAMVFRARDAWLRRIALRNRIFVPSLLGDRLKEGEEARVPIAERADDLGELEVHYKLDSNIGAQGASQLTKLWRY